MREYMSRVTEKFVKTKDEVKRLERHTIYIHDDKLPRGIKGVRRCRICGNFRGSVRMPRKTGLNKYGTYISKRKTRICNLCTKEGW